MPALVGKVSSEGRLNVAKALAALTGAPAPWLPTPYCEAAAGWVGRAGRAGGVWLPAAWLPAACQQAKAGWFHNSPSRASTILEIAHFPCIHAPATNTCSQRSGRDRRELLLQDGVGADAQLHRRLRSSLPERVSAPLAHLVAAFQL